MYHLMYLFGSILWDLIRQDSVGFGGIIYQAYPVPLWLLALLIAATAVLAGGLVYYRGSFLDRRIGALIGAHWYDCKKRFERDLSMARTADEVGKAIENFAKCWGDGFKNK
jgi:hypothetical protein